MNIFKLPWHLSFVLFLLFVSNPLLAQAQLPDRITVKAGESILEAFAGNMYRYATFRPGQVAFLNNRTNTSPLNYNLLTGEINFLTKKGDTLSLDNISTIRHIAIGPDTFYYAPISQSAVVKLAEINGMKLFSRPRYILAGRKKVGAYGQLSSASTAISVNEYFSNNTVFKLKAQETLDFALEKTFFVMDQYRRILPADKQNLLKIMGDKKGAVEKYMMAQNINFKKEEDLKKLIQYYTQP